MILRTRSLRRLTLLLREHPVVGILGARQTGKTTLAHQLVAASRRPATIFDLEDPRDLERLREPTLTLSPLRGLVVLDEIQRRPELFPVLRVLADRRAMPARFLVLGSASPELLRQSSETLAGRIAFQEQAGFDLAETGPDRLHRLWLRGGFPRAFLARSETSSIGWRRDFIRTFLERDIPQLGFSLPAAVLHRFWAMIAHHHAQLWNSAEFARAFGVSDHTVRRYLDVLSATFVVRALLPWHENLGKRQVKSPRIYVRDSGLLHSLLAIETRSQLEQHPKVGASWEGFAIECVIRHLGVDAQQCYFWRTHTGAELDLLVMHRGRRLGFEMKLTDAPSVTPSMRSALADLRLDSLDVIHAGKASYPLAAKTRAVALERLLLDVKPLVR